MAGELEAAASLASTVFGQKQLGAPAPAFNPQGGGLLDTRSDEELEKMLSLLATQGNFGQQPPPNPVQEAQIGVPQTASVPADTTNDEMGPPAPEDDPLAQKTGFGGLLDNAFGNVDANLQSPSKVLGLGLLSSIDPRLAQGGLLASALFGPNRLFGK